MSGELRVTKSAVLWTLAAAVPATGAGALVAGARGALSVLIAVGLVVANASIAAGLSAFAGARSPVGAPMIALPSFAVRMTSIVAALAAIRSHDLVSPPVFAVAFGVALTVLLVLETRTFKRTPWLALTFEPKELS